MFKELGVREAWAQIIAAVGRHNNMGILTELRRVGFQKWG